MNGATKMDTTVNRLDRTQYLLAVILALGFLLNVCFVGWGLPHIYYPDESFIVNRALRIGSFNFDPEYYGYGVLHVYFLALLYGIHFVISLLAGWVHSADDFAVAFFRDPSTIYLISRLVSVVAGTLTLLTTYFLGKKLFGQKIGLLSASALALCPLTVMFNHTAKTEPLLALVSTLTMLAFLRIWEQGKVRDYRVAGICYGASISLKFPAIMLGVPFLLAHCFSFQTRRIRLTLRSVLNNGMLAWGVLFAGLTCVLTNPYAFLPPTKIFRDALRWRDLYSDPQHGVESGFSYWFTSMADAVGIANLVFLLGASLFFSLKGGQKERWLMLACLLFWLPISMSAHKTIHWLIPIFPLLYVLSSHFLVLCLGALNIRSVWLPTILAFSVLNVEPAWKSVDFLSVMSHKDTRTLALEWVEQNIPANSKILMDKGRYMTTDNVPIRENRANLEEQYRESLMPGGDYEMRFGALSKYFEYRLRALEGTTYDVTPIYHGTLAPKGRPFARDNLRSLDEYRKAAIQYVIVSSAYHEQYARYIEFARERNLVVPEYVSKYFHFYRSLDGAARLVKRFEAKRRPGPTITIYQLQ